MTNERGRYIAIVLALLVVVSAATIVVAVTFTSDPAPYQGEEVFGIDDGPEVVLVADDETDVNFEDMFATDGEILIETGEGVIVVGGDLGASARVDVTEIEGEQTVVTDISGGAEWLHLDPADKQRLDVRGDVDAVQFRDTALDDGQTDLEIIGTEGGIAELRLYDLPADQRVTLYDPATGDVLVDDETDSAGTLETDLELQSANQQLEVRTLDSYDSPTLENPEPVGEVTEIPDELSVNVQADAHPVDVTFELEGEVVDTVTVTEDGTVSVPVDITDLGAYEWSVTAEDDLGQTTTREYSFETPRELTIREEHDPQTIVDNSTLTLRFFSAAGDIAIEREAENGTLDMDGLPNVDFVVLVESEDHYDRRVYLGSIFEQEDLFILNRSEFSRVDNDAVSSRFIYTDLTGQFPRAETTLQVQRAIDINGDGTSQWRTVAGDFWGAGGEFEAIFEQGARYRLVVQNQETGATNVVGTHIPTEDLSHEIRTSGLTQEGANATGVYANAQLDVENGVIEYVYNDPTGETDELRITVRSQNGDEVLFEETIDGPLGPYQGVLELNETQLEEDWVVEIESNRHQSVVPVGSGTVGLPVDVPGWLMTLLMCMAVTFVGALYGPRTALLGAWAMVFVASGVAMFGWAFSWPSVVVATLVAIGVTFFDRVFP